MRKTLMILAILVFGLPLSAYSCKTLQSSTDRQSQRVTSSSIINKNQKYWQHETAKIDVIHSDGFVDTRGGIGTSLDKLSNLSKAVIQGTVYNLERMNSPQNMALTKASVHVDAVISGDETLQDKTIYLALNSGILSVDQQSNNSAQPRETKHDIFVKYDEFPLPSIGSKVIAGLLPNQVAEPTDYNKALKQSGFDVANSYTINMPQYNLWIKKPTEKKYHLNNPKAEKKLTANKQTAQEINQLTKELNQKYNTKK